MYVQCVRCIRTNMDVCMYVSTYEGNISDPMVCRFHGRGRRGRLGRKAER